MPFSFVFLSFWLDKLKNMHRYYIKITKRSKVIWTSRRAKCDRMYLMKKNILKIGIFVFTAALLAVVGLGYYKYYAQKQKPAEIKTEEKIIDEFSSHGITPQSQGTGAQTSDSLTLKKKTDGTYEPRLEYVSEQIQAKNEFTALAPVWTATVPPQTSIDVYVAITNNSLESEWIKVEADGGKTSVGQGGEYAPEVPVLYIGNSYRYKIVLSTQNVVATPVLDKIRFELINSLGQKTSKLFPNFLSDASAATPVSTRSDWGCPEPTGSPNWPPEYPADYFTKTKKIIMHHTVTQNNPVDPSANIRAIWYYHTYTRGWGDIGYNYLIDQNGQIYEGRYGGANVIGGHAYGFNTESMGVAMLGDFSTSLPTTQARHALALFLGQKSFEYQINPSAGGLIDSFSDPVTFSTGNIDGHRAYASTACPGAISIILPDVRQVAQSEYNTNLRYRYPVTTSITLSNNSPAIGESLTASFSITNKDSYPVTFSYIGASNRLGSYYGPGYDFGWDQNITLAPGEIHSFSKSRVMTEQGTYGTWIAFVINGTFYYALPDTTQAVSTAYIARAPNITVTNGLAVNTASPIAGQNSTYTITVINREPNRINFSNLGIQGRRLEDMSGGDIYWDSNSFIEPNTPYSITASRALPVGHYSTWPAVQIGNAFYNIYVDGAPGQTNVLNFEVRNIKYAYPVTSSITLSNANPAIGETLTASYVITNTSSSSVTLGSAGVSNRLGGYYGPGYDLGWEPNVLIPSGGFHTVTVSRILTDPGDYGYWAAYVLDGVFYYAVPQTNQIVSGSFTARVPNITVVTGLAVNPNYPPAGQNATYTLSVINREPSRIYFSNLGIQGRKLEDMSGADVYWVSGWLEPQQLFTINATRALPIGHFSEWPAMQIGGRFYNIYVDGAPGQTNVLNFMTVELLSVLDGVSIPTISGLVGREQHLYLNATEANLGRTDAAAAIHYAVSGTPAPAQNGMAGGYGAFGANAGYNLPIEDERYYINMRWNYVTWYEAPDGTCSSVDGHPDTCTTGYNSALKNWHYRKKVIVTNPANGKRIVASIMESGPAIWTNRVSGLSPEAMYVLGATTNNSLTYYWAANQSLPLGYLN
jgi:hypothetical protein